MSQPTKATPFDPLGSATGVCSCGAEYRQQTLQYGGPRPLVWPNRCPACLDAHERARALEVSLKADRDTFERLTLRRRELGTPALYQAASLAGWQSHGPSDAQAAQTRARTFAERWISTWPRPPLVACFSGGVGTGKTYLAWALARAVVEECGGRARVVKLSALVRSIRETWRKGSDTTEAAVLRDYTGPDMLVLDECSRHALYGAPTQHLYDVLDARLELERPTVLTSNETDEGLMELLGPSLIDRLEGYGGLVDFGSWSWRRNVLGAEPAS